MAFGLTLRDECATSPSRESVKHPDTKSHAPRTRQQHTQQTGSTTLHHPPPPPRPSPLPRPPTLNHHSTHQPPPPLFLPSEDIWRHPRVTSDHYTRHVHQYPCCVSCAQGKETPLLLFVQLQARRCFEPLYICEDRTMHTNLTAHHTSR